MRLCEILEKEEIPGAMMECGVMDGGGSALMAYTTRRSDRPVHMFDSWQGLPAATGKDGASGRKWIGQCVGSPVRVFEVMRGVDIERRGCTRTGGGSTKRSRKSRERSTRSRCYTWTATSTSRWC